MTGMGHRKRKQVRTRRALITAAIDLFDTQGYEETTIAQISAEADISPRTFFSYFPGKADVLFADARERIEAFAALVGQPQRDEGPAQVLRRALVATVISDGAARELTSAAAARRVRLVMSTPDLQNGALRTVSFAQERVTQALLAAFPAEIDPVSAAAAAGALTGALVSTAFQILPEEPTPPELQGALEQASDVALNGVHELAPAPVGTHHPTAGEELLTEASSPLRVDQLP